MRDFLKTVHEYARRQGCSAHPTNEHDSFEWFGDAPKPTIETLEAFEVELEKEGRIEGIRSEANKRVDAITGDQTQVNQDLALAVGVLFAELRHLLSDNAKALLDPLAEKRSQARLVRQREQQRIADPSITTWE